MKLEVLSTRLDLGPCYNKVLNIILLSSVVVSMEHTNMYKPVRCRISLSLIACAHGYT